jgi:gluconolactonase
MKNISILSSAFCILAFAACSSENTPTDDTDVETGAGGIESAGGSLVESGGSGSGGLGAGGMAVGGTGAGGVGAGGSATGGVGSGGAPDGVGGDPGGVGGAPDGAGGMVTGSGGAEQGAGFVCPLGSETGTPVSAGKTLTTIAGVPEIVNNGGFLEGPLWHDGKLFLSQLDFAGPPNGATIFTYTPGGDFAVFLEDAGTNGLALAPDGRLVAASQLLAGVVSYDLEDASAPPQDIARTYAGNTFNSPNDLVVRSDGTVYFTDPTHNCAAPCGQGSVQGVYRVPPGGAAELIPSLSQQPNGIILSPDESILYVGGSTLSSHPVSADGSVGTGTAFGTLNAGTDGLGMDCAGNLYVALHSAGELAIVDPSGQKIGSFTGIDQITNIAFGGPENKTMYITSFGDNRGMLRSVEMEVPGFPY